MIKSLYDTGKGRAFCFLSEAESGNSSLLNSVIEKLTLKSRLVHLRIPEVTAKNWKEITSELEKKLDELKIRQVSLVGIEASASIAQNLALQNKKLIRSLVLIDAASRAHASKVSKFIDEIEKFLPLGLPLRRNSEDFYSLPFLQRLRCPVLVLSRSSASEFIKNESKVLAKRIPVCWEETLVEDASAEQIAEWIFNFENVPAKCPQKRKS